MSLHYSSQTPSSLLLYTHRDMRHTSYSILVTDYPSEPPHNHPNSPRCAPLVSTILLTQSNSSAPSRFTTFKRLIPLSTRHILWSSTIPTPTTDYRKPDQQYVQFHANVAATSTDSPTYIPSNSPTSFSLSTIERYLSESQAAHGNDVLTFIPISVYDSNHTDHTHPYIQLDNSSLINLINCRRYR